MDIKALLGLHKMKKSTKFKNMEKEGRENKNTKYMGQKMSKNGGRGKGEGANREDQRTVS